MEHNENKLRNQITKRKRNEPIKLRILSIEKDTGRKNLSFLAIDKEKRFVHGNIDNKLITDEMVPDKVIECIPSESEQEYNSRR